ncbi:MAG: hypothetical protein UT39_C0001G0060 [Candidatus Woesebacteria bacterium GW2011_GWA1_39_21]|uniref:Type II secretion system protein GspG C-terminal domain-containing protein n=1 Tax=Candidatus Woesebacteria bacterium GW2011_GWA1_39_21 TaxID=1618550 RepID=A0A0G0QNP2_9BACT|nr:MAG: hypothetical protein UT39_C0001G0060 [Candidatus Woesebacteria bacterium GW2011_GWA1_39_21]
MNARVIKNGFTLIELLVVVSIMVILIGLSAFGLQQARESARDGQRKANLETIRTGLSFYKADCNVYPTPNASTTTKLGTSLIGNATICGGSANTYIQKMPTDPVSGRNYYYSQSGSTYKICAGLEGETSADANCAFPISCGSGVTCSYSVANP